jgi:hypothetical protein
MTSPSALRLVKLLCCDFFTCTAAFELTMSLKLLGLLQGHLTYYKEYASLLASWGYAVLQYDIASFPWLPTPKFVPWPQLDDNNDEV